RPGRACLTAPNTRRAGCTARRPVARRAHRLVRRAQAEAGMNPGHALLGAVLSGFADIDSLTEIVQPGDFFEPRDGEVWSAALRARETGNKIDPVSVRMAMGEESSKLPGGPVYLVELAQEC